MKKVEEKVSHYEENMAILKNQLDELRSSLEQLKSCPTDHPPK
jgi:prefoldin subunit 5